MRVLAVNLTREKCLSRPWDSALGIGHWGSCKRSREVKKEGVPISFLAVVTPRESVNPCVNKSGCSE